MNSRGFLENTGYSFGEKCFNLITSLLLIPFIISRIGINNYGVWIIFGTISSYFGLAQFGLSTSFEKFISEYNALGKQEEIKKVFCTSLYTLIIIAFVVFIVSFLLGPLLLSLLIKQTVDVTLFYWLMGITSVSLASQIFLAVPRGYLRYDVSSVILIVARFAECLTIVIMLMRKAQIEALVYGAGISCIIQLFCHALLVRRIFGTFAAHPKYFCIALLIKMYGFGIQMQLSFFAMWIAQNVDKLIIGYLLNTGVVGFYDLGTKIVSSLRQFFGILFLVLIPKASQLSALNKDDQIKEIYLKGTKYVAVISLGMMGMLFPIGEHILTLWLHHTPDPISVYVLKVLLIGFMVHVTTGIGSSIARGINKPNLEMITNICMVGVNILLSITLYWIFRLKGIVWGTNCAALVAAVLFYWLLNRHLRIPGLVFIGKTFRVPILLNAGIAISGTMLLSTIQKCFFVSTHNSIVELMIVIGVQIMLSVIATVFIYRICKYFNDEDYSLIKSSFLWNKRQ